MARYLAASLCFFMVSCACADLPARYQVIAQEQISDFSFEADSKSQETRPQISFKELTKGRVTLLHLWSTGCPSCTKELPRLDHFAAQLLPQEYQVVALSLDDPKPTRLYNYFMQHRIMHLRPYHRAKGRYPKIRGLPTTFVFNKQGDLVGKFEGVVNWDDPALLRLLQRLQDEKTPEPVKSWIEKIVDWFGL
jgi:thiol-disulfide isomerase/thioredoxin